MAVWPGGDPYGDQRDHEAGEVTEEVCSVRGDGEAVGEDSTHDLSDHEEDAEHGSLNEFSASLLVDASLPGLVAMRVLLSLPLDTCIGIVAFLQQ